MKFQAEKAIKAKDWTRFEIEYLGKNAHQLTQPIMECTSDEELKRLILSAILDKYMLFYVISNRPHKITKLMLELLDNKNFEFETPISKTYALEDTIEYMKKGSGLFPLMYKIQKIWGVEAVTSFIDYLILHYKLFRPNSEHMTWTNTYVDGYQKQFESIDDFLKSFGLDIKKALKITTEIERTEKDDK